MAFELGEIRDGRVTVAGARRDDDGPAEDGSLVLELEGERLSRRTPRVAGEAGDHRRHRELRAELLGLGEAAPGELLSGDAGGKAEEVLDSVRSRPPDLRSPERR